MKESDILYETTNLYLCQDNDRLEVRLHGNTHSVVVGFPKDTDAGKRFMNNAERYIGNLRAMYQLSMA